MKLKEAIAAAPLLPEAALSLLRARNRLVKLSANTIIAELKIETGDQQAPKTGEIDRISGAIRIAARLAPFRSDCLVQAMAAKSMLSARHLPHEFYVGVASGQRAQFSAHAWLKSDGRIVVGGDVSAFAPLIEPKRKSMPDPRL